MSAIHIVSGDIRKAKADVIVVAADGVAPGTVRFVDPVGLRSKYLIEVCPASAPTREPSNTLDDPYETALTAADSLGAKFVAIPLLIPRYHRGDTRELHTRILRTITDFPASFEVLLVARTMPIAEQLRELYHAPGATQTGW